MSPESTTGEPDPAPTSATDAATSLPGKYPELLSSSAKWAVGALAAVAATAVARLGLDRFGKGSPDIALVAWAFVGLILFVLGVLLLVAVVLWHSRSSRITLGYLADSKRRTAQQTREFFERNLYLLDGEDSIPAFRDRLNALVAADDQDPEVSAEFARKLSARESILVTGRAEWMRAISTQAFVFLVLGSLVAALGAAVFAFSLNRASTLRTDRLALAESASEDVVTGELLPHTPSPITLVVPPRMRNRSAYQEVLGQDCNLAGVGAIAIDLGSPPSNIDPPPTANAVIQAVTEPTAECSVATLWIPPEWVIVEAQGD